MNPAKEYLLQIRKIEDQIRQIEWNAADIRSRLTAHGIRYDGDRVQTSAGDPMSEAFARLDEVEREERRTLADLRRKRTEIAQMLYPLPEKYSNLLYLRYCKLMRLDKVADTMGYSYEYIRRMHGEALREFGEIYPDEIAAYLEEVRR